jgi:hypothetical protein
MAGKKGAKHKKLKCTTWVSPELAPFRHRYMEMKQGWRDGLKAFVLWSSGQGRALTPASITIEQAFAWDDQELKAGNLCTRGTYLIGLSSAIGLLRPDLDAWPLRQAGLRQHAELRPPRTKSDKVAREREVSLPLSAWPSGQAQKWAWAKGGAESSAPTVAAPSEEGRRSRRERFGNITVPDVYRPKLPKRSRDVYKIEWSWGRWLKVTGEKGLGVEPLEQTVEDFVLFELKRGQAKRTVATNLGRIARMAQIMLPGPVDTTWIWNAVDALDQEATPVRDHDLIHPGDAKFAGEMEIARARSIGRTVRGATAFRDGLLVLVKVAVPGRGCNIGELEMGKQLQDRNGELWICWEGKELKHGKFPHEYPLPVWLTGLIREYLADWRHILTDSPKRFLWGVGRGGGEGVLATSWINKICKDVTGRHLEGRQCRGHGFRHGHAAAVSTERPQDLPLVSVGLQHRDPESVDIYRRNAISLQAAAISEAVMTDRARGL